MTAFLLDINVLLALTDPMHIHHKVAHGWFGATGRISWATCPITENGFVRIASHPQYPNRPGDAQTVLGLLRRFCVLEGHVFWPEDVSLREIVDPKAAMTHGQITDLYLIGLAVRYGGKLATLDQRIHGLGVAGGKEALEILPVDIMSYRGESARRLAGIGKKYSPDRNVVDELSADRDSED